MTASMSGHKEVVKVLLSVGAKVGLLDKVSSTLYWWASLLDIWCNKFATSLKPSP